MADDSISATTVIDAPVDAVFGVLADPARHPAIDGTGWVVKPNDGESLTAAGQIFRMAMYHPQHPDGDYEIFNEVQVFEAPNAISWKPGYDTGDGTLTFGGWVWRYDLAPAESGGTDVTLTYDWANVPDEVRQNFPSFPPFPPEHLSNSLAHLSELVTA